MTVCVLLFVNNWNDISGNFVAVRAWLAGWLASNRRERARETEGVAGKKAQLTLSPPTYTHAHTCSAFPCADNRHRRSLPLLHGSVSAQLYFSGEYSTSPHCCLLHHPILPFPCLSSRSPHPTPSHPSPPLPSRSLPDPGHGGGPLLRHLLFHQQPQQPPRGGARGTHASKALASPRRDVEPEEGKHPHPHPRPYKQTNNLPPPQNPQRRKWAWLMGKERRKKKEGRSRSGSRWARACCGNCGGWGLGASNDDGPPPRSMAAFERGLSTPPPHYRMERKLSSGFLALAEVGVAWSLSPPILSYPILCHFFHL